MNVWPNAPFQIDSPNSAALFGYSPILNTIITRDLYHRFFEEHDADRRWQERPVRRLGGLRGGTVMGCFDGDKMALWELAHRYTLADNFFQGAYGGSFPEPPVPRLRVRTGGVGGPSLRTTSRRSTCWGRSIGVPQLAANPTQPASALTGPTSLKSGNIAPLDYFGAGDGYRAVNTMQPAYQPSGNAPADANGNDALYANPTSGTTPRAARRRLTSATCSRRRASAGRGTPADGARLWRIRGTARARRRLPNTIYKANTFGTSDATNLDFQSHHQPFNYYADLDPGDPTRRRALST